MRRVRAGALPKLAAAVLPLALVPSRLPAGSDPRPNVIVLLVEGLRSFPAPELPTPNLDRLSRLGRRFDRAYSVYPRPDLGRAAVLTGQPPSAWDGEPRKLGALPSLPGMLAAHGYATARVGRLLGAPLEEQLRWGSFREAPGDADVIRAVVSLAEESRERPFLIVAGLNPAPPPARDIEERLATVPPLVPAAISQLPRIAMAAAPAARPDQSEQPPPRPDEQRRHLEAVARARLASLDASLEMLFRSLDRLELWSHTIVVLTSDHVPATGEHGLLERPDTLFESTLRVPLVIAAPGLSHPGVPSAGLVETLDIVPTLLELSGLPLPDLPGTSLVPLLRDPSGAVRSAVVSEAMRSVEPLGRSIRSDRYRFSEWPDGSQELYDYESDPHEWRNLAVLPGHEELVERLRQQLGAPPAPPVPRLPAVPRARNVLLLVFDDLSVRLGTYGYPLHTPNIDRLARMGRRFDRAYAQAPSCSPSRTSFLTGLRPERTGIWSNAQPVRERIRDAVPINEHFRANGYFTARIGKVFHQRWDPEFAWDVAMHDPLDETTGPQPRTRRKPRRAQRAAEVEEEGDEQPDAVDLNAFWVAEEGEDDEQADARRAHRAVELLEEHRKGPFFIAVGFAKPHMRWLFPKKYLALYPPDQIVWPEEPGDDVADIPMLAWSREAVGRPRLFRTPEPPAYDADERRRAIAAHNACVSFVDTQVGVVLDALSRLELWDTTTVVLFGDHGFHLGEHGGLWRKNTLFEDVLRVPLLIATPGLKRPGEPARGLVELLDVYPTLVELAGLPQPAQTLEGQSLVPLLDDPSRAGRPLAHSWRRIAAGRFGRSVRDADYRFTEWPDGSQQLYDLRADPGEAVNLARSPAHAATLRRLQDLLYAPTRARRDDPDATPSRP
ncbi:MAG TPA: sulfatase-like hydrolase/transferase [Vicinamibacteria bacterium]|nr:sulfatase-like hydrolase/transferase [Vicinamibacteria bacterium]